MNVLRLLGQGLRRLTTTAITVVAGGYDVWAEDRYEGTTSSTRYHDGWGGLRLEATLEGDKLTSGNKTKKYITETGWELIE